MNILYRKIVFSLIVIIATFTTGFAIGFDKEPEIKYKEIEVEKIVEVEVEKEVREEKVYGNYLGEFEITSYDLSIQSCGKAESHPEYGITATGYSLVNKSIEDVKIIAVDPRFIPLHSKVYIEFNDWRSIYNGVYLAKDKGGAIKGNKIDIFMEDTGDTVVSKRAMKFGRVKGIKVWLLDENYFASSKQ